MNRRRLSLGFTLAALTGASLLSAPRVALAQLTPGFATTNQTVDFGASVNIGAVAFAPTGTLYAVPSPYLNSGGNLTTVSSIEAVIPTGAISNIPLVDSSGRSVQLYGVGGATWDPYTNTLLVVDNKFGSFAPVAGQDVGTLYSIPVTGPQAGTVSTIATYNGDGNLAQVAVRGGTTGAGQIFVSDAYLNPVGATNGSVFSLAATPNQVYTVGTNDPNFVIPRSAGLTYAAGIGFTADGSLVVQQLDSTFTGRAYQTTLGAGPTAGTLDELPASANLAGSGGTFAFDLAVVNKDDVYLTGANFNTGDGGIVQTDTTSASFNTIDNLTNATGISFLPGVSDFAPFAGANAGLLAFVPDTFSGPDHQVVVITPVPEPSTVALLALAAAMLFGCRLRRGSCA
jgi:hypothetical protein